MVVPRSPMKKVVSFVQTKVQTKFLKTFAILDSDKSLPFLKSLPLTHQS